MALGPLAIPLNINHHFDGANTGLLAEELALVIICIIITKVGSAGTSSLNRFSIRLTELSGVSKGIYFI